MVESEDDRFALLRDFGVELTYEHAPAAAVTITGIVSAAFVELAEQFGTGVAARGTAVKVRSADLPAGAARGDAIALPSGTFKATELHPDGTGFTIILLERSS